MEGLLERLRNRVPDSVLTDGQLIEYLQTMSDRICLRLGVEILPTPFPSICVDATVKMVRRTYYEGISSEGVANISTAFVDDILSEYASEFSGWLNNQAASGNSKKVVSFL